MNASAQLCQPMSPIQSEIDALRQRFPSTNVVPLADGSSVVSVPGVRLDSGWSKDSVTVHFLIPVGYPHAQPDCFNVDLDLTLASGALPQNAQHQQLAEVGQTLWFSWHLQRPWKPGRDTRRQFRRAGASSRRLDDRRLIPPTYGAQTLNLSADAMDALRDRILVATGSQSQSMDMTIAKFDAGSAVALAANLVTAAGDANFVARSNGVADRLADAQQSRGIPGGVLAVFTGSAGNPARPLVGYIKAELHGGFRRAQNLTIEYIKTLFMTPHTKLYKIGLFSHDGGTAEPLPGGWSASVYDSHMSLTNPEGAARYFFEGFLGLELPQSAPRMTRKFWEGTRQFIQNAAIPEEKKADLFTGLYSYLKVDQTPTVEVGTFANAYLDPAMRDNYRRHMAAEDFPMTAVPKDLSELANKLKRRRVRFSRDVQLSAPADAFADLITIETINQDGGAGAAWTRITIKDHIRDQQ